MSVRNFKSFADSLEACWSSDDEAPPDRNTEADKAARRQRYLHRQRSAEFARAWRDFLSIFNGHVWAPAVGELGPHYSPFLVDVASLRTKAVEATMSLLFRALPVKPQKGRWTKLAICLDWHLVSMGFQSILEQLGPIAYSAFKVRVSSKFGEGMDP